MLARPEDHLSRGPAVFHAAQANLAQKLNSSRSQFFEITFHHTVLNDWSSGKNFDSSWAKGLKHTLCEYRHRLQADNIFGTSGRVHLPG